MQVLARCVLICANVVGVPVLISQQEMPLPAESEAFRHSALASATLRPAEKLGQYARYNWGALLMVTPASAVVGFIGPDYQRLRVKILTVAKSAADPTFYQITGKTQVLGLVRSLRGTLRLQQVREAKPGHLYPPGEGHVPDVATAGITVARYELAENQALDHTGIFRGLVVTKWYIDHKHRLHYDDTEGFSDGYCNNQFVGTWTSYATKKVLRCNWGDGRIPNSGDLDIGAGDFSPAEKYASKGWQGYYDIHNPEKAAAREREKQTWWK